MTLARWSARPPSPGPPSGALSQELLPLGVSLHTVGTHCGVASSQAVLSGPRSPPYAHDCPGCGPSPATEVDCRAMGKPAAAEQGLPATPTSSSSSSPLLDELPGSFPRSRAPPSSSASRCPSQQPGDFKYGLWITPWAQMLPPTLTGWPRQASYRHYLKALSTKHWPSREEGSTDEFS